MDSLKNDHPYQLSFENTRTPLAVPNDRSNNTVSSSHENTTLSSSGSWDGAARHFRRVLRYTVEAERRYSPCGAYSGRFLCPLSPSLQQKQTRNSIVLVVRFFAACSRFAFPLRYTSICLVSCGFDFSCGQSISLVPPPDFGGISASLCLWVGEMRFFRG